MHGACSHAIFSVKQLKKIRTLRGTGFMEGHKPTIAMVALQISYAAVNLTSRAALTHGMSPRVVVVYRQAIATIVMAPIAYFVERWRKPTATALGVKSLSLMFIISLIGVTANQNCYFMGMSLTSSSIASAMGNLLPAVTFVMAASLGLEKVNIRSLVSVAKVIGTVVCVMGAVSMASIKGSKLLNVEFPTSNFIFQSKAENWVLGCALLFGSCCCWSVWLILQVPMSKRYPDHLSLSAWMCFFATIQSGTVAIFLGPDLKAWELNSSIKILCSIYTGIMGSGILFYVQSWCISKRGPLFSAMFNPLCTVIVTISACDFLHEELYVGSLVGAIAVVGGLYAVLWGKAHDIDARMEVSPRDGSVQIKASSDESTDGCKIDIKEPLLGDKLQAIDRNETTQ
ncbi:WAT1-related protein At4g30420-like [Magnolia sinica]|uniref:WAT1-related protein At4g30420-like n=1 Tax=Magnolia sinica TaxID=86752 RepID=UPI00265B71F7|nr:WAT1-related protein At4g30420-like [Magnolia sinica]